MKYGNLTVTVAATLVLTITGCATHDGVEADYGNSVRHMTEQQIYDMNAAASPDPNAVLGGDPDRLNNTLDGHRQDVAKPAGVDAPVTINVGGGQ
jgi:hypothetical protein